MNPAHMRRLGDVPRCVILKTIKDRNVAEHSFHVTWIYIWLCDYYGRSPSVNDLLSTLCHDEDEAITGDIPHTAKEHKEVSAPHDMLLRAADMIEFILTCDEENRMGNGYMLDPRDSAYQKVAGNGVHRSIRSPEKGSLPVTWMLDIEPRPVQVEAARRSLAPVPKRGWAHFMEMRLGKTYVGLNDYVFLRADSAVNRLLVIAPNRYKYGWAREIEIAMPGTHFVVLTPRNRDQIRKDPEILVVNYEGLNSRLSWQVIEQFVTPRTMIIWDESVLVKNPRSMFFKNSFKLSKKARYTRILTGLPAPNAAYDLWAQFSTHRRAEWLQFFRLQEPLHHYGRVEDEAANRRQKRRPTG